MVGRRFRATAHFADAHLEVATDHVRTPTRPKPRSWTVVHRKAAVIVAPMTREEKIVLICQERVPIRAAIWEMPAGQIDNVFEPDQKRDRSGRVKRTARRGGL